MSSLAHSPDSHPAAQSPSLSSESDIVHIDTSRPYMSEISHPAGVEPVILQNSPTSDSSQSEFESPLQADLQQVMASLLAQQDYDSPSINSPQNQNEILRRMMSLEAERAENEYYLGQSEDELYDDEEEEQSFFSWIGKKITGGQSLKQLSKRIGIKSKKFGLKAARIGWGLGTTAIFLGVPLLIVAQSEFSQLMQQKHQQLLMEHYEKTRNAALTQTGQGMVAMPPGYQTQNPMQYQQSGIPAR